MEFEEVQSLPRALTMLSILPGVALVGVSVSASAQGVPVPVSEVVIAVVATLGLGFWLSTMALITRVDSQTVTLHFRGLFKTRKIPISEVQKATARTYRPLREYGGWGIKYGPSGWAYNVSGNQGVQFNLASGRPLLVGSKRPEEFAEAVTSSPLYRAPK